MLTYQNLIKKESDPFVKTTIKIFISDAYLKKGATEKALDELNGCLKIIESATYQNPAWIKNDERKQHHEKAFNDAKLKSISKIKEAIGQIAHSHGKKS